MSNRRGRGEQENVKGKAADRVSKWSSSGCNPSESETLLNLTRTHSKKCDMALPTPPGGLSCGRILTAK